MKVTDIKTRGPVELLQDVVELTFIMNDIPCTIKVDGRSMTNMQVFTRVLATEILAVVQEVLVEEEIV